MSLTAALGVSNVDRIWGDRHRKLCTSTFAAPHILSNPINMYPPGNGPPSSLSAPKVPCVPSWLLWHSAILSPTRGSIPFPESFLMNNRDSLFKRRKKERFVFRRLGTIRLLSIVCISSWIVFQIHVCKVGILSRSLQALAPASYLKNYILKVLALDKSKFWKTKTTSGR